MDSMEWLMKQLINDVKKTKRLTYQKENELAKRYAKMIKIQSKVKYGDVMEIEHFIECVKTGGFIPYDGYGYYWDEDTQDETEFHTSFNVDELKKQAKKYKYVVWYNK